jgi:hypothetical protein
MRSLLAVLLFAGVTAHCFASDGGVAAVQNYIDKTKHWRSHDYSIEAHGMNHGSEVYWVTYLPDLKQRYPGGGESFEAWYNPRTRKVTKVLHTQ